MDRAGRGCNRKQHGQRWPSPILERPDRKPRDHRRVGEPVEHAVEQGAQELARTWSLVI
jgi:hypothetical protein